MMLRDIEKRSGPPTVEPDERFVRARVEDRSWWIRVSYVMEKYRALIYLVVASLVYFGFGVRTPKSQFEELGAKVDATKVQLQTQIDTLKIQREADLKDRATQTRMMRFSVRYICSSLSAAEKYRLGGDDLCADAAH
jgi:hypothetical protein